MLLIEIISASGIQPFAYPGWVSQNMVEYLNKAGMHDRAEQVPGSPFLGYKMNTTKYET